MLERIIWPAPAHGAPKKTRSKKWLKNLLRSVVVAFTVLIALVRRLFFCFRATRASRAPRILYNRYLDPDTRPGNISDAVTPPPLLAVIPPPPPLPFAVLFPTIWALWRAGGGESF